MFHKLILGEEPAVDMQQTSLNAQTCLVSVSFNYFLIPQHTRPTELWGDPPHPLWSVLLK